MPLFGPVHLSLLAVITVVAVLLSWFCRNGRVSQRATRLALGIGLCANELGWWVFRYWHEGIHLKNLPLQLCDASVWAAVLACLTLAPAAVEFAYFVGFAGAGMAVLTPDLWSPWPTYPAIYFFVGHGGILIACAVVVFGGIAPLRRGAVWRAYGMLVAYAALAGTFNAITGANYMYLCRKPANASLLDALGPWPWYLVPAALLGLAAFWALSLPIPDPRKNY